MKCSGENVILRGIFHVLYNVFHYISCYIAEIWIAFPTVCDGFMEYPMETILLYIAFFHQNKLKTFSPILFSCSKRLCEAIGPNLRKDDSCGSPLTIYLNCYLSLVVKCTPLCEMRYRLSSMPL